MPKKILAAYIYQVIQFDDKMEFTSWKRGLRGINHIEDVDEQDGGKIIVRVKKAYNTSPMEIVKG